jgi:Zn-dependent metalloprotease
MKEKYLIILLFLGIHCFPQTTPDTTIFSDWNESAGFYLLKSNTTLSFQEALLKVKNYYGLNSNSSFVEYNSKIDSSGTIHKKYQHTYNSIPVYGSKIYVHGNANGKAASLNGYIINRLNTTAVQAISSENAINIAINESRASQFFWQDVNYENALKEDMNNQSATYYPSPELLYFPLNNDKKAEYTLCYKLLLCSIEPYKKEYYFIDASNGNVLHKQSAFEACHSENPNQSTKNTASCSGECIGGQTNTLFYGAQYVKVLQVIIQVHLLIMSLLTKALILILTQLPMAVQPIGEQK